MNHLLSRGSYSRHYKTILLRPDLAFLIEMMGEICIALVVGPRGLGVSFSSVFLVDARDVLTESP